MTVTLMPGPPSAPATWRQVVCLLCSQAGVADGIANVLLFIPLGFALALCGIRYRGAILAAAGLSLIVESAQFFIPGRDPSLGDLIFNTLGAGAGIGLGRLAPRWVAPSAITAARLSLLAALGTSAVWISISALLLPSLPETFYFGGSALMQSSDKPLRLGNNTAPDGAFRGRIDEVRIYRRARSRAEVQADMRTPVDRASPDLVAAYDFKEGAGGVLTDVSGHRNHGAIRGATWTTQGRSGSALDFADAGAAVVIPHSPSLDLTEAMTLEAWIYPAVAQAGWRAVVQKEFDTYFLLAASRMGPLKPVGGGTFGASTESVATPAFVSTGSWTHVAITYDGAVLQLYVNGVPRARRLRWYPGRIVATTLDGLTIPAGLSTDSPRLRDRLLAGSPLRVRAVAAPPVPSRAPLAMLQDAWRNEIILLAAHGDDLVFHLRTRAAALHLQTPTIRASGVLRGLVPGEAMEVVLRRPERRYCVDVNGRSTCELGYTLGVGWAFLAYAQVPFRLHAVLNLISMSALAFPTGFWMRRRWESVLAAGLLAVCLGVVTTIGSMRFSWTEAAAAVVGLLAGRACAALVAGGRRSCGGMQIGSGRSRARAEWHLINQILRIKNSRL